MLLSELLYLITFLSNILYQLHKYLEYYYYLEKNQSYYELSSLNILCGRVMLRRATDVPAMNLGWR